MGGARALPNRVWGSATGLYSQFIPGPADSDAWTFDLLSDRAEPIRWITSREALVVGTPNSEWVISGGQNGITPSAVFAKRQTTFGSSNVQGKLINENIVFVQKGGR
jgi:hypothetical protein